MAILARRETPPELSRYQGYKPYLRRDFYYSCVYCTVHENDLQGWRYFDVEHFRPKSLPQFSHLEVVYSNLLYACSICNTYKSNDWPSDDPINDGRGYLDPCEHDYDDHFAIVSEVEIKGRSGVGQYMVEHLHLNRVQLQNLRRRRVEAESMHRQVSDLFEFKLDALEHQWSELHPSDPKVAEIERELQPLRQRYEAHKVAWEERLVPQIGLDDYR